MSFYGNVATSNQSQFTFDKTYSNRYAMEQNISVDGVYIGRYVLVEYNVDGSSNLVSNIYTGNAAQNPGKDIFYLYTIPEGGSEFRLKYTEEKNPSDPSKGKDGNILKGQNVIVYSGTIATFYQCIGFKTENNVNYAMFKIILDGSSSSETYIYNYTIDLNHYSNVGRSGYDSTVWQKVIHNNVEKYVMIAELNSVVPTFTLTVDAPTETPIAPHFDTKSTSTNYNLHIQPPWGFRIKKASDSLKSDQKTTHTKYVYNPSSNAINTSTSAYNVDGDIYYNAAGFNEYTRTYVDNAENYITMTPGKSSSTYNVHSQYSDTEVTAEADDVQELSVHLPVIGNMVCTLWDIIHGEKRDDGEGSLMHLISQAQNGNSSSTTEINALKSRILALENKVTTWDAAETNIQADWTEEDSSSDAYIKNKPTNLVTIDEYNTLYTIVMNLQDRIETLEGTITT